jgi:hypothetical protein
MTKQKDNNDEVGWGPCCFCGQEIEKTKIDPCRITVECANGLWQVWFCHSKCFKDRISKESPCDLSPAHF